MTERLEVADFVIDFRIVVVSAGGVLDLETSPILQSRLVQALALHHPPHLVIDLSGVTYADSFGLTVLLATDRHVRSAGGRLLVCATGLVMRKTLAERGLDRVLDVRPTLAEAVRALHPPRPAWGDPPE
ncbi:STAS domain-containing protein [Nonomuraea zeae]|uniref:Anti-sigma factor antagonist n=1 Tax=Nonomuraea zeae TaxID=1642303 RepID=A0A5S4FA06_9ACTN|nr:STAS domain-containing protein [Nonomuraea zeae]TMR13273.1 anti-sigma factor antagonist [Nonomuraea zeae]